MYLITAETAVIAIKRQVRRQNRLDNAGMQSWFVLPFFLGY